MRIYKPRVKYTKEKADQLLKQNEVKHLPIKVKKIAKKFPDLKIKSYSWYAKKYGLTFSDVVIHANSNDGCCWYRKDINKYIILYNDQIGSEGRKRWTIAHELGHYMLKHNELTDKAILARNELPDSEYKIFEYEANLFARNLLAPEEIISKVNPPNGEYIAKLCNLSLSAAQSVFNYFKKGSEMNVNYDTSPITKMFSNHINALLHRKQCNNCDSHYSIPGAAYCPYCGSDNYSRKIVSKEGESTMRYYEIQLDGANRATECPRCSNESIKGDFCDACGIYLVNKCTGRTEEQIFDIDPSTVNWKKEINDCNTPLKGDQKFCHECGSVSTFLALDHLEHWHHERDDVDSERRNLQAVPDVSDDELPF